MVAYNINYLIIIKSLSFILISSKKIVATKVNSGRGVGYLISINQKLLFKWIWRFLEDVKVLWVLCWKSGPQVKS